MNATHARRAALALGATLSLSCGAEPAGDIPPAAPAPPRVSAATEILRCPQPAAGGEGTVVTLDRNCSADADCAWVREPLCCGPLRAIGVHKGADEHKLDACGGCPSTACEVGPLVAEDAGHSTDFPAGRDLAVTCDAGVCRTRMRK